MAVEIRSKDRYQTSLDTLVMGPLRLTAVSKTDFPDIKESLVESEEINIPLATYETGLFTCVNRGAKFSRQVEGGVQVIVKQDFMTRAPVIEAKSIAQAHEISEFVKENVDELRGIAEQSTRNGKVVSIKPLMAGNDVYVRLAMQCGEAAGHNMTTRSGTDIAKYLVERFEGVRYGSDSGNVCTDKKAAAINAISGRGKFVTTEIVIPRPIVEKTLKTTPELLERLNVKKNLQGSILAGSQFSANAHYANIVAAMYIATGQDIANIVEGSYGITKAEANSDGDLYFSTTHPCLIVGTKGHGKDGKSQARSLDVLKCRQEGKINGYNSQRLAAIVAAATAMGELSLLCDQTKSGRLIEAHEKIER